MCLLQLSTIQAFDPQAHPPGPRVRSHQSFVSVSSFTLELLSATCWEEKNPLICFGICQWLSQILPGTEHEQAKLIQVPGDAQSLFVKQGQSLH